MMHFSAPPAHTAIARDTHRPGYESVARLRLPGDRRPPLTDMSHVGAPLLLVLSLGLAGLGLMGLTHGGGGLWMLMLLGGLYAACRQVTLHVLVERDAVVIRTGLLGEVEETLSLDDLDGVWIEAGTTAQLLGIGRVVLANRQGDVVKTPWVQHPVLLKQQIVAVATNRQPLWLPLDARLRLGEDGTD